MINGKKYISFTNGVYTVSYKHDVSALSSEPAFEVIISNGQQSGAFYWDYAVESGKIAELCPKVGDYCGNGKEQLAFSFYEKADAEANYLHVVAGDSLMEYYFVSPESKLETLVTMDEYMDAGRAVIACVTSDGKYYYVALPDCSFDRAERVYPIKTDDNLTYTVNDDSIVMESFVTLGDGNYIGKIKGKVVYSPTDMFRVLTPTFYLFAEDDFCDLDSISIAEPISLEEIYKERIPVTGDKGERLLVPVRDDVEKHSYYPDNFRMDENGRLAYYENDVKQTLTGIDVSKWQYDINWKKVAASGVDYAIIRLGYRGTAPAGKTAIDSYYEKNMKGALNAGLQVGVYYFTQARTVEEAIEEANIVLEKIKGYKVTFPIVYDTEYTEEGRANELSNADRTACAKAFCDTILAAGYTPVIYANTNWSILNLNMEELQGYDFWYAYYGEELYYPYNFTMWQYTDKGTVDGVDGAVDLNISFIDYSQR